MPTKLKFFAPLVSVARNTADDLTRSEGREVSVEEETDLQLPFLLPEDGYSSDIVKGIPQGVLLSWF